MLITAEEAINLYNASTARTEKLLEQISKSIRKAAETGRTYAFFSVGTTLNIHVDIGAFEHQIIKKLSENGFRASYGLGELVVGEGGHHYGYTISWTVK